MWDYLPPEVLIDILTRLPVDSLVRFTCVCKSWYSLITNPTFITSHLNRAIAHNENNHLLVRHYTENSSKKEHYTLYSEANETFDEYANLDFAVTGENGYFSVIGSCNGLVCLSDDETSYTDIMILWNPSIRKFVTLPTPNVTYKSHEYSYHSLGFGFHSETNDYKIVRVVYILGDSIDIFPPQVELFELGTGSWRRVISGDFPYVINERAPQAFLNGVAHWVGYNTNWVGLDFLSLIVSFNMDNELFGAMMVPESIADQRWPHMRVAVFEQSLSLIQYIFSEDSISCCIWVMKEYGVPKSWTKHYSFALGGELGKAFGFRENGDVLMGRRSDDLVSYNPKSKQIKNLGVHGSAFHVDNYMESLVLLERVNGILGRHESFDDAVTCERASISHKEEVDETSIFITEEGSVVGEE